MSTQPFRRSNIQPFDRRTLARSIREEAAEVAFLRPHPNHINNGEEDQYSNRNYIANYSKGLPHYPANSPQAGEVDPSDYRSILRALTSGIPDDFESIPLAGDRRLVNPQAGLAFDLEGPDSNAVTIPPAPRIDSAEAASEMAEVYWMALCRDINFDNFGADPMIDAAAEDLENNYTNYTGPRPVDAETIFRGFTRGDLEGPYISQFLYLGGTSYMITPKDGIIPYGSLGINQRQLTILPFPDSTFVTTFDPHWINNENGITPPQTSTDPCGNHYDPVHHRFIRNMRDLANYVHIDDLPQQFWNACLILIHLDVPCMPFPRGPVDQGNPYRPISASGTFPPRPRQEGFGTLGDPNILALIGEVTTRALKACWFQKWFVHRRLRPEEFGGLIHKHLQQPPIAEYPMINGEILRTGGTPLTVLDQVNAKFGSFLVPQVYPEASPLHPSYPSGHATIAGACVTILKAYFDESSIIPNPVIVDPADNGTPEEGTRLTLAVDANNNPLKLTVGNELDKLASNTAIGRNIAGLHYRSDYVQGLLLGEQVAIGLLEEQKITYNENFSFTLRRFDGTEITI